MSGAWASPLGALVGLLMGAFGGGGSLIAIPILVYIVGQGTIEAQATALVIVSAASLAGLAAHLRGDDVRWRMGLTFGLAAGASALVGSAFAERLDPDVLLLAFSPVMIAGAWLLVSDRVRRPADFQPWRFGVEMHEVARVVALGLAAGLGIGLFGVGGGFVIVPVLVLVLHLSMVEAVGTSLLIVLMGSAFALANRIADGAVDATIAIPFSIAALLGAVAGRRLAERANVERLQRGFAGLIVVAAVYTGVRSAGALL
jgi:uncharacterized protein